MSRILGAAVQPRHYRALSNMARSGRPFATLLTRYLLGTGRYPYRCRVKRAAGTIEPTLYSYFDVLTLNEIFFRQDYRAGPDDTLIVDLGSNIGLSALYFLTRNRAAQCHLFEPDPRNVERLKKNLAGFEGRYTLSDAAVSDAAGSARFGLDTESGRYGGLDVDFGTFIDVRCRHVNDVLAEALEERPTVDILKIDTEGSEIRILNAIADAHLRRIRTIYLEASLPKPFRPDLFHQQHSGTVCCLRNRALGEAMRR